MPMVITRGAASAKAFGWSGNTGGLMGFTGFTAARTMNGSSTTAYMYAVAVNSSRKFVAVGYNASNYPVAAYSTDGTTWTTPALMNGSSVYAVMRGVAVNSAGKFVAVGNNTSSYPVAAYSTDGTTWTTPALMNGSSVYAVMSGVTVNSSGLFVAVGWNASNYPVSAYSTDGTTWTTPATMNGSTTGAYMFGVAVNSSGLFAAVGRSNSTYGVAAYSTDGITWTTPALLNGNSTYFVMSTSQFITVNSSGLFVAVGTGTSSKPIATYSSDGMTWSTPAAMNGTTNDVNMTAVTVNNTTGKFIAVGQGNPVPTTTGGSILPAFATSTNGTTWTTPVSMNGAITPTYPLGLAVDSNGRFVMVGYGYGNTTSGNAPVSAYSWDTAGTAGQQAYTVAGTYTWVAPANVTKVSVVALGNGGSGALPSSSYVPVPGPCCACCGYNCYAGGGGGGGGAIAWANNQTVTPANSYTVTVRAGNAGAVNTSFSTFASAQGGLTACGGGFSAGGTVITGTGYSGGSGGGASGSAVPNTSGKAGGGGGAAGYASAGGNGGYSFDRSGDSKTGGGGGGASGNNGGGYRAGTGGGGSFIMGTIAPFCSTTGTGGIWCCPATTGTGGLGVYSGGANNLSSGQTANGGPRGALYSYSSGGTGGAYGAGGGGAGAIPSGVGIAGAGFGGAVRVIWPGCSRSYPSTCVQDK